MTDPSPVGGRRAARSASRDRSGTVVRRTLVILLVVAAGLCAWVAFQPEAAPAAVDAQALATPVWSMRRLPQPVVDEVGTQSLQRDLGAALDGVNACVIVGDDVAVRVSSNADQPLTPASTEKVLTGYAALDALGAEFRFATTAVAGTAVTNGRLDRLWLVGSGDPTLTTADYRDWMSLQPLRRDDVAGSLEALADAIVAAGVQSIPGGVAGDESRYDAVRYPPTWRDSYRTEGQSGPIGALVVNDGFTQYRGATVPAADPAAHAASELTALLTARGVAVGAPSVGTAPAGAAVIATVQSAPLADIVASMTRSSDNLTAEMLTRELAVKAGSVPGTTDVGTDQTVALLTEDGYRMTGTDLVDGSGLDRGNLTTCGALFDVYSDARVTPQFQSIDTGLAVAGESGTLARRFVGTDLEGRLRAKTGTLNGVTGLVGVVDGARSTRFALVANGSFTDAGAAQIQTNVAEAVAAFPAAPPADQLVPAPESPVG